MAGIRDFFINKIVPLCEETEGDDVDISTLIEYSTHFSPIVVNYRDKTKSETELVAAIILNFCNNYAEMRKFPKVGIKILNAIIRNTVTDADVIAQHILLLHFTKVKSNVDVSLFFFSEISKMKLITEETDDELKWKEWAIIITKHKQINDIIDQSIVDFGFVPDPVEDNVKVSFVQNITSCLRGFVGFGEIFINAPHFHSKINAFKGDATLLPIITKMEIFAIVLHEYSHVKIRKFGNETGTFNVGGLNKYISIRFIPKGEICGILRKLNPHKITVDCTGNLNMSSPTLAELKGLTPTEFGVYNEYRFFKQKVDWFKSVEENLAYLEVDYMKRFIKAIENNSMLPKEFIRGTLPRSDTIEISKVDIYQDWTKY